MGNSHQLERGLDREVWRGCTLDICSKLHIWASLNWGWASLLSSSEVSGVLSSHRANWSHLTALRFCSSKLCLTVLLAVSVAFPDQPSPGMSWGPWEQDGDGQREELLVPSKPRTGESCSIVPPLSRTSKGFSGFFLHFQSDLSPLFGTLAFQ